MKTGPVVGMIWAQSSAGVIGKDNSMPWHLPEDLAHFKKVTMGKPVVMGRKTWESLPERFRPLPGRKNIVITSSADYVAPGAEVVKTLEEALRAGESEAAPARAGGSTKESALEGVDVWVMGGGQLYRSAMDFARTLAVTVIEVDVANPDTFAPEISDEFLPLEDSGWMLAESGLRYSFRVFSKTSGGDLR